MRPSVQRRIAIEALEERVVLTVDVTSLEEILASVTTTGSDAVVQRAGWSSQQPTASSLTAQLASAADLIGQDDLLNDPRFSHLDGAGYSVVVLDTGIDLDHPFFGPDSNDDGIADRIVYNQDFISADVDADDVNGHGTHVSSIIGSEDATFTGVAAGVNLIHLQVLDDAGFGTFAAVESALQWVISNAATYNIVSVNLSLSDGSNSSVAQSAFGVSDEFAALEALGVVSVAAAGNLFSTYESIEGVGFPASDPNTIAVGAVWSSDVGGPIQWQTGATDFSTGPDRVVSFSQRHETLTEIFAPGAFITAAGVGGGTATFAGTSQASPFVAGTVAIAQQLAWEELGRALTVSEFRDLLVETATPIVDGDDEDDNVVNTGLGFGRLDVLALAEAIEAQGTIHVVASDPADDAIISTPPTQFTIDFSEAFAPTTIQASDLVINGIAADSFVISDADTVVFSFSSSPVTTQGLQSMTIAAGAVAALDLVTMQADFNATFRYDALPMQVTATQPMEGGLTPLPLTEILLDLNEPVLASSIDPSDLNLSFGTVTQAELVDADTVRYTLSGIDEEVTLLIDLAAGALTDTFGNPSVAKSFELIVDVTTLGDLPFELAEPAVGLGYTVLRTGQIGTTSDVDAYTFMLDAGQHVSLVIPTWPGLQAAVAVRDPTMQLVVQASATQPGELLQLGFTASSAGTYTIEVMSTGGTTGGYQLLILLNGALESELFGFSTNNTIATAQDVEAAFAQTSPGIEQAAIIGGIDTEVIKAGPDGFGYEAFVTSTSFEDISNTGNAVLTGTDNSFAILGAGQLGGFTFDYYGVTRSEFHVDSNGRITFDANDGSPLNTDLTFTPGTATIAALWDDLVVSGSANSNVYWEVRGSSGQRRLIIQWNDVQFKGASAGDTITFQAILYEADGVIDFNYLDLNANHPGSEGARATVGIKDLGFQLPPIGLNRLLLAFDEGPNDFVGTGKSVRLGPNVVPTAAADYYALTLQDQQSITLAASNLDAGHISIEVVDASDVVLATGTSADFFAARIDDFVAPAAGTYYVRVTGDVGIDYELQFLRGGTLESETNDDLTTAQAIGPNGVVHGRVGMGTAPQTGAGPSLTAPLDVSGSNLSIGFAADGSFIGPNVGFLFSGLETLAFGQELASYTVGINGTTYTNGAPFVSSQFPVTLTDLSNGSTKAVLITGEITPGVIFERVVTWEETDNYALVTTTIINQTGSDLTDVTLLEHHDPDPLGEVVTSNDVWDGGDLVTAATRSGAYGLASADPRAVLSVEGFGLSDPDEVLSSPEDPNGEPIDLALNVAFAFGDIAAGSQAQATFAMMAGVDAATLEETFDNIATQTLTASDDFYSVSLHEGEILEIETKDLLIASPPSALLDPALEVFDPSGISIASDTGSAADGRNARLTFVAPSTGTYIIRVFAEGSTEGNYVLEANTAPTVEIAGGPIAVVYNEVSFELTAADPNPSDQDASFTYEIDWDNDRVVDEVIVGGPSLTISRTFRQVGPTSFSVTAVDHRGAESQTQTFDLDVAEYALLADEAVPGQFNLVWGGTSGDDHVVFREVAANTVEIETLTRDGQAVNQTVSFAGVTGVVIAEASDGNDRIDGSGLNSLGGRFNGAAGSDTLIGGEGDDVLFGDGAEGADGDLLAGSGGDDIIFGDGGEGQGDDILSGGSGNDVLIGDSLASDGTDWINGDAGLDILVGDGAEGSGASDILIGSAGEDLVISGLFADPTISAVTAIRNEWTSGKPLSERIDNLSGSGSTGVNGDIFLIPGETVLDDNAVDLVLNDDNDADWYLIDVTGDTAVGLLPEDWVTDV